MKKEKAIARLILSTKRKKRQFDLCQVAKDIDWLLNNGESINSISQMLGISSGMTRQFLQVNKLCPQLKSLVKERVIDSVTLVDNLTKFNHNDQAAIAKSFQKGELSSSDIRVLSPLRNKFPNEDINNLIQKLVNSKNKKISVIKFPIEALKQDKQEFISRFKKIVGSEYFDSLIKKDSYYELRLHKQGEKKFRKFAKENKQNLTEFFNHLIS